MKNLEEIPKKNVFEVPEGYFDRLPGIIQARVTQEKPETVWIPYLRFGLYALPLLAFFVISLLLWTEPNQNTDELLASVDTASLVAYLDESDISTDDLMDSNVLDQADVDAIQENTIEAIEIDEEYIKSLGDEFGVDYF